MRRNKLALTLLFALLASCVSPLVYPRHALVDQILRPRAGHEGALTNRACSGVDEKGKGCKWEVKSYRLDDAEFRQTANTLHFICNIGGRRFKICLDKPGFCRRTFERHCFLGICGKRKLRSEEYLPITNYKFLLDADTRCFAVDNYPFEDI